MGCADNLRSLRNWVLIWRSGAFDAEYYLRTYPDVVGSRLGPLWHYCRHGWREGRNPSPEFCTKEYLSANPDVKAAGIDPLCHYLRHGKKERRSLVALKGQCGELLKRVGAPLSPRVLNAEFFDEMAARMREALYGETAA